MIKSAVSKVMWVGKATVFLVGLAVIVALTVGVVSQASAQNRPAQNVFFLGATNTVNAMSSLVGSVSDSAMLLVENNGGGPALDLKVEPGQAPMKVNSGAKVDNLNADTVDGKSREDFYAAGSKVADSAHADQAANADKVDNLDSTTLLPGGDLPRGRTVRGNYDIRDYVPPSSTRTTLGSDTSAISFGYRLSSAPAVRIIKRGETPPTVCPGTVSSPEAAPGYLCVYESIGSSNLSGHPFAYNVTSNGASLYAHLSNNSDTNVEYYTYGTWAVTGN